MIVMKGKSMDSLTNFRRCHICNRLFTGEDPKLCSMSCRAAFTLFKENLGKALEAPTTGDPRTFFYDMPLGHLIDFYTILCLKRIREVDIQNQQEFDFHMSRLRRAIQTKISIRSPIDSERHALLSLSERLLSINAQGWHANGLAHNQHLPLEERKTMALEVLELSDRRAALIRQIDLLVSGRTLAWKYF